jgi:23S rRNA (cytidine1920-2'-O)/16S rRNA (cytidine1409-2'-O)-methyltransferase
VRRRLDVDLVRRGLCSTRELAQEAIGSGRVLVRGAVASKPSHQVDDSEPVELVGNGPRFVGRGGEKLDGALEHFGIDVTGIVALDAGASTGGFTDCLLQRGARSVVAVDVGHGQLHERLRADARVENHERVNVRTLSPADLGGRRFALIVADLSFISLRAVAASLVGLCAPDGQLVVLVKPQFEARRSEVSRGKGVVKDPAVWLRSLIGVRDAFTEAGAVMMGAMGSPLRGTDGNVEFLVHVVRADAVPIDFGAAGAVANSGDVVRLSDATLAALVESVS